LRLKLKIHAHATSDARLRPRRRQVLALTQELVSPEDGVLEEILVAEGDVATIGQLIAKLGSGSGAVAADKGDAEVKEQTETPNSTETTGASLDIDVPNVGESVSEVTIATWMKQVGDAVAKDEAIVELETDKAAQELVAPRAGVITEILVAEGDVAAVGQTIARMGESNSDAPAGVQPKGAGDEGGSGGALPKVPPTNAPTGGKAMPSASRIIQENSLDQSAIAGTGKGGRITKGDALNAKANPPAAKAAPLRL